MKDEPRKPIPRRVAVVTLVICALLTAETVPSLFVTFSVISGTTPLPYLLVGAFGLILGCVLGVVLLRQGGVYVPSRNEKAATRGALIGFAVGAIAGFLIGGSLVGLAGVCTLVGLAVGRAFGEPPVRV